MVTQLESGVKILLKEDNKDKNMIINFDFS